MEIDKQEHLELSHDHPAVVYGHKPCLTREAKWLCIDKIYSKFHRPNFYDIGGTYIEDVADYWFTFRTEIVGDIFLFHLFILKKSEGSFAVSLSANSELTFDKKNTQVAFLKNNQKEYNIQREESNNGHPSLDYIVTYHFTDLDVEFLKDRKLYISVDFPAFEGLNSNIINDIKCNHDYRALLEEPFASDFCIESADGIKFKVHKMIISAHSEVFKAMLKEETAESQNNYVKLIDVNGDDLRCMLEFMYTGTVNDLDKVDFVSLLMLSDRYDLKGLRELAQYALAKQINIDNALDILIIADMYDSDMLKRETFKFIKKNKKALHSVTFKEVNNANIIKELCMYLAS
ncbi:hypothetical protein K1T71_002996 [Dendrolimus kikuchii]|uniref:Uncharacterized protein n=1 Tax=Dendrolimus kikuchii TaxID=765133 RepID=A0ACC1DAL2_9NEOP|nr:hypothetical protein K1T71_002996 [Dendrolimus kikuchii]